VIDGNIKIFELSKALYKNGATASASSGASSEDNLIDFDKTTRWESVGSSDTTTETLTIIFDEPAEIDRILISNHNFKSYTIYPITDGYIRDSDLELIDDNAGGYLEDDGGTLSFTNVLSFDNPSIEAATGISETDYSRSSSYYEFDSMFCSGITTSITAAQEVNDEADLEKYCFNVIASMEIGKFESYPELVSASDFQAASFTTINRFGSTQKLNPVFSAALVKGMVDNQNDIDLLEFLNATTDDFIFWANGGAIDDYRFQSKPYRPQDFYQCQTDAGTLAKYIGNIYVNSVGFSLGLKETI